MPPAARQGDPVSGTDIHVILVPSVSGTVPTPMPMPFAGRIQSGTSTDVLINGFPAATSGSIALNVPPHVPAGGPFQRPPSNQGRILAGSPMVLINSQQAARLGDQAMTCNDPVDLPNGVVSSGSPDVMIG
jgi:uncharacterized Zn-binding protein involved in type VI secretion